MTEKTVPRQFWLTEDQQEHIRRKAFILKKTQVDVVRELIDFDIEDFNIELKPVIITSEEEQNEESENGEDGNNNVYREES